jgi:hypothetical protein
MVEKLDKDKLENHLNTKKLNVDTQNGATIFFFKSNW